jgi:DNA-binding FadR family transcriptional regulator
MVSSRAGSASKGKRIVKRSMDVTRSAYAEVASVLGQKILSGEIEEGERLPAELMLAEQLGTSRSTVREAFRVLQASGLARRVSPRIMVASRPEGKAAQRETRIALIEQKATYNDVYETIHVLAPALVSLAAKRATKKDIEALRSVIDAQQSCLSDILRSNQLAEQFQALIATVGRNPAMALARSSLRHVVMPTPQEPKDIAKLTHWALNGHKRIVDAIEAHDAELAALVTRRHLEQFRRHWENAGLDLNSAISSLGFGVE